jgi:hypothetical protein
LNPDIYNCDEIRLLIEMSFYATENDSRPGFTKLGILIWDGRVKENVSNGTTRNENVKKGFTASLEEETRKNTDFYRMLYTGKYSQTL